MVIMAELDLQKAMKKIHLAWKKWNDAAVGKDEKDVTKETIERWLKKYGLSLDWKTGKVTKQEEKTAKKQPQKQGMSTKDLINFINEIYGIEWTGKNLRRRIRQMDKWNDGKMTHYDFSKEDVIEIIQHLGYDVTKASKKLA